MTAGLWRNGKAHAIRDAHAKSLGILAADLEVLYAAAKGKERRAVELARAAADNARSPGCTPSRPRRCITLPGSGTGPAPTGWPSSPVWSTARLAQLCGGPLPLTPREREIAEQLVLSVRTVEGHVYRACFKLGVADRDELGKLFRKERPDS